LNRWRLELLRRLKGGTLWTRRGGYWLPFHGDGDLQEIQYQLEGELWFQYETERLREYLRQDAVVVDVGANLGFTALLFAKLVGPGGKIYAFEPSPAMYAKLLQVVEKNQLSNVRCFNLGCGTARKRETLLVPASSGNATIRRDGVRLAGICREISIEIDTLDHVILPLAPRVDFLKIDTEGFEDQVLAGAEQLIARDRPIVYIELSLEYGESSARAIAWLRERGYTFDRDPDLTSAHNGDNFLALP
jgi:FkbM family methyltransferase